MSGISNEVIRQNDVPANEEGRLQAIGKYQILDTEAERDFDNIVELASHICNTPIAIITLLDKNRQWFKAKTGWCHKESHRNLSFCTHTILQNDLLVVPDATIDSRFSNNPFVTEDPRICFYAGMPITTNDGFNLGTLAVIDRVPRTLTKQQLDSVKILARQVMALFDLRLNNFKLQESNTKNAYLANVLEHTTDAIFSTNTDGCIISWNKGAEKIFGISKAEAIGKISTDLIGSYISDYEKVEIRNQLKKNGLWEIEKPLQTKHGINYFVQYAISAITNQNGGIDGFVIIVKDISDKKLRAEALQKNNEGLKSDVEEKIIELKNVFERVSDGFIAIDGNGICTYANNKAEQMVDRPKGNLIGKYIWNEFDDSVEIAFRPLIQKAMDTQLPQYLEVYYPLYDRWFENYIYPSTTGLSIYFRDVTKKKNAEINLKRGDETLRLIMNSALDAIICMDNKGAITVWNAQAEKMFGWQKDEVIKKQLSETIIPVQHQKNHADGMARYRLTGVGKILGEVVEITALHKNGKEFPIELAVVAIKQNDGEFFCAFIRDITERKLSEQKIIDSEERYREIVETAQEGIWVIDENSYTTFVNDHMALMLGYEKEEMKGKHLFEFIDSKNRVLAEINISRRKLGIREQHDFSFLTKDNKPITTSVKTNPIFSNGVYKGALAMVMDVTQRRRMEEKIILSEKRFRALIENSTDGLTVIGTDGIVLDMSPASKKILGYEPKELIGKRSPELIHGDDRDLIMNAFEKIVQNPNAHITVEYRHLMPDGSQKWLECMFNNLVGEPSVKAIVLNYRDITERKKSEEALLKANERFKLITDATNDVVWDWDLINNNLWWNENYFSLFEYDKATVQPDINSWYQGLHPDDKDRIIDEVHHAIKDGLYYWVGEYRFAKSDGTYLDIYDRAYMLYDKDGIPFRMIGAMMDMSNIKRAESQLKSQFEELQKKNYELDRFVYSVSHDIRAPLASVMGLIHIAEMEELSPTMKKYLNLMQCSINRLDDFIREILDYSRNSRTGIRIEKIAFGDLIKQSQQRIMLLDGANRLKVNIEICGNVEFYSDPARISILLNNLLTNAVTFQDYQKESSFVTIKIGSVNEKVVLSFYDNGLGIETKFLDKIFDMFYKASSVSTGSGLGLYIVKEIVIQLRGSISVKSEAGHSTEVEIILPNERVLS
jgi:PAS domain S-box-containing protein